ncbi:hypothetical protein PMIN04_008861 [Paraphaeosphaeria minitans]
MLLSLTVSCFVVYASFLHIAIGRLQYQVVWFVPCIVIAIIIGLSFFAMSVSPRWLMLAGREEEAVETLVALRGLPAAYLRIIQSEHVKYRDAAGDGIKTVLPEIFLVPANLRRVQQAYLSYSLAQLSGVGRSTDRSMFLTGMYSMSKFYTLIASFIFIDALGRRKSLFVGISVQMISDIYIGVFLKYKQAGSVAPGSSEGAIAAIYIHGFGYAVFSSSHRYVFGAELSPNNITSFGSALTQTFHWLFYPGVNKGTPSTKGDLMPVGVYVPDAGKELGCDGRTPKCQNCVRACRDFLVEDPATGLHRPRDYVRFLEARVAYLEGILQESRPDVALDHLDDQAAPFNQTGNTAQEQNNNISMQDGGIDFLAFNSASPMGNVHEENVDDLSSEVALLCLSAAGRGPHYFGSSSAASFSRIFSATMGLPKRQGSSQHSIAGAERHDPEFLSGFRLQGLAATLTQAYSKNIHTQHPFLHRPTFRVWAHAIGDLNSAGDIALFFVLIVYAIGSLALGPSHHDSAEAY